MSIKMIFKLQESVSGRFIKSLNEISAPHFFCVELKNIEKRLLGMKKWMISRVDRILLFI